MSAAYFLPGVYNHEKKTPLLVWPALLFFFFVLTPSIYSQELSFKRYGTKEGLPSTVVYQCVQDKKGFIWFTTNRGASRFDGKNFKNFTKENGLPDNDIIKIYADSRDNIWFISFLGIPSVLYNDTIRQVTGKETFFVVEDIVADSILLLDKEIVKTTDGEYHMGYYRSLNQPGEWNFSRSNTGYSKTNGRNKPVLRAATPLGTRFYFSDVEAYTTYLHARQGKLENNFLFTRTLHFSNFTTGSFIEVSANKKGIIFYTPDTLYYADIEKLHRLLSLQTIGLNVNSQNDINSIFCENDSTLWLCTKTKGLVRITNFMNDSRSFHYFFAGRYCSSMLKDKEGGYWITTLDDGVYYVPNLNFFRLYNDEIKIQANAICIKSFGPQQILAGFTNGTFLTVHARDVKSKIFTHWSSKNKNNRILDITPYSKNNLIISSDEGLYMLSTADTYYTLYDLPGMKATFVRADSTIIIATAARMHIFDVNKKTVKQVYGKRVTCVTGLGDDFYWGTLHGAYGSVNHSPVKLDNKEPILKKSTINHIDIATDSSLWISTPEGIVIVKKDTQHVINKNHGLLSNSCKHVLFDRGTAWISTEQGISRMEYKWKGNELSFRISNIMEADGLISNEVNQTAMAGDYIWAATEEGISYFPKSYTGSVYTLPPVAISGITTGNTRQPLSDTIEMGYRKNSLLIEVFCPSYRSCQNILFEYRIPKLDTTWHVTTDNIIGFSSLPFGQFALEVRALNKWGQRTASPKKLLIINDPPFWKSAWFAILLYISSVILLSVIFYFFHLSRQRKKEQSYRMNQKVRDLEIMALRAQMNPHFIFNCLSSIQHYILEADVIKANLYLHKFSALIRKTFQYSNVSSISLADEIESIRLYLELEKMRLQERMDFMVSIVNEENLHTIYIPPMIIQPYIENAVKHGVSPLQHRQGIIIVRFEYSDNYIHCFIEDNGKGIKASGQNNPVTEGHTSMGNSITVHRIDAINSLQKK